MDFLLWFNWLTVPSLYFPIPLTISSPIKYPSTVSYYVQLQVISQSPGTLHPDQNSLLQLCAEAHCQPVCPCARPVIGWPGICDEGSASPEDVCCPSCKTQGGKGNYGLVLQHLDKKEVSMLSELKTQTEYIPLCKTGGKKEKEDRLYGQQNYVFFPVICYYMVQ